MGINPNLFVTLMFAYVGLILCAVAGWITHVVICIKAASYGFMVFGAIIWPVGIVHGYGHWFGVW